MCSADVIPNKFEFEFEFHWNNIAICNFLINFLVDILFLAVHLSWNMMTVFDKYLKNIPSYYCYHI